MAFLIIYILGIPTDYIIFKYFTKRYRNEWDASWRNAAIILSAVSWVGVLASLLLAFVCEPDYQKMKNKNR